MGNTVIAGDYVGKRIGNGAGRPFITTSLFHPVDINKETVESYEVITEEIAQSAASGVARGIIGGALLGSVGALAGTLTAKQKGTYTIAIQFKDGKKSLIEVDDKIYKTLMKVMF